MPDEAKPLQEDHMKDALKGYLELANGLTEVTLQKATAAAKALVAQGEATAGQVTSLADDLLNQSRNNREALNSLVKFEVDKALGRVGLASIDEVNELTARVRSLEAQLRETNVPAATATPSAKPARQQAPAKAVPKQAPVTSAQRATTKTPTKTPTKTATKTPGQAARKPAGG